MVTQQSWMFLRSFTELRFIAPEEDGHTDEFRFRGLLSSTSIEVLAHLGRYAFSEIGNAAVAPVLFVISTSHPQ